MIIIIVAIIVILYVKHNLIILLYIYLILPYVCTCIYYMHNGWIASRAPAAEFKVIDQKRVLSNHWIINTKDRLKMTQICGSPSL